MSEGTRHLERLGSDEGQIEGLIGRESPGKYSFIIIGGEWVVGVGNVLEHFNFYF